LKKEALGKTTGKSPVKVLIVGDFVPSHSYISMVVHSFYEERGMQFKVDSVINATMAFSFAEKAEKEKQPFDVVLVDEQMFLSSSLPKVFCLKGRPIVFSFYNSKHKRLHTLEGCGSFFEELNRKAKWMAI